MKERKIMEKKEGRKENIVSFLCRVSVAVSRTLGLPDLCLSSVSRTFGQLVRPQKGLYIKITLLLTGFKNILMPF